jgi:hypothetical protein
MMSTVVRISPFLKEEIMANSQEGCITKTEHGRISIGVGRSIILIYVALEEYRSINARANFWC